MSLFVRRTRKMAAHGPQWPLPSLRKDIVAAELAGILTRAGVRVCGLIAHAKVLLSLSNGSGHGPAHQVKGSGSDEPRIGFPGRKVTDSRPTLREVSASGILSAALRECGDFKCGSRWVLVGRWLFKAASGLSEAWAGISVSDQRPFLLIATGVHRIASPGRRPRPRESR